MNKKMVGFNVLVAVLFVLLFVAHLIMLKYMPEWNKHFATFWPNVDSLVLQPLLAFTTGYALFSSLFSLLKAKLEIEGLGRRNLLRIVMSAITLFFVAMLLLTAAAVFGGVSLGGAGFFKFVTGVCQAEWLWLILGIYWFLSLNALRVNEFEPLED